MSRHYLVFRYISGPPEAEVSIYGHGEGKDAEEAVKNLVEELGEGDLFTNIEDVNRDASGFMAVPLSNVHNVNADRTNKPREGFR